MADDELSGGSEHRKGARESTRKKHEKGKRRKKIDHGGERGDEFRRYPRKRPKNYIGKWPPRKGPKRSRDDV